MNSRQRKPPADRTVDAGGEVHGGNIYQLFDAHNESAGDFLDFSANLNPLGPPPWLRSHINRRLSYVQHYPDPHCSQLIAAVATRYRLAQDWIVAGNGSSELLFFLPDIVSVKRVIIPEPSYLEYRKVFARAAIPIVSIALTESDGFRLNPLVIEKEVTSEDLVIFGNPANPAGTYIDDEVIRGLAARNPDVWFVVDEAFHEFVVPFSTVGGTHENIITLNSLTKFFSIAGLRIGFATLPPPYTKLLKEFLPPWSVNTLAQSVATEALGDDDYCAKSRKQCRRLRQELGQALKDIGAFTVYDSHANYLLLRKRDGGSVNQIYTGLLEQNIAIRRCANYPGLDDSFFRVAVRDSSANEILVDSLQSMTHGHKVASRARRTKDASVRTIMFQGTSSHAGKSVLGAALCRILKQDGVAVAPFKAQNMSLNSYVTPDGGEIGWAQALQAFGAGVEPHTMMNPVLLKPNSETGSQVIVNGKPVRNMDIHQYHQFKETAWKKVAEAFDALAERYEVIVLEGAGSPGEINLKSHDIVNMAMARYARAPVLLIGDIDRGGVYASFAGIMDVLEEWERNLIAGFIVNKFRGDQSLLAAAHEFVLDHTGRPVYGVIPYFRDLNIPEEDSVFLGDRGGHRATDIKEIDIAVMQLPHIANFTDFQPFEGEPEVSLRFVASTRDLLRPDVIIIPGSKNVAGDLSFLHATGLAADILRFARSGAMIIGICAGFQMLGVTMRDPLGLEGDSGTVPGLGLLTVETELRAHKTLLPRVGTHIESGLTVQGYEIHHGHTISVKKTRPVLRFTDGETCGAMNDTATIWGVYLHGLFDDDQFRRWFIDSQRRRKNLVPLNSSGQPYDLESQLDTLAGRVRDCLDMNRIYDLMDRTIHV
jgi:adenosylcobyric acid synthase